MREWIKSNLSEAGAELRSVDQKDRNVMLFNDWLEQNGYRPFADWVKDEAGWKPVVRFDDELQPMVPTAESLIGASAQDRFALLTNEVVNFIMTVIGATCGIALAIALRAV